MMLIRLQSVLVAKLLFYVSAACASMSVVEFIIALKGQVKVWIVDVGLRIVTPIWGLASVVTCAVFLGLSTAEEPVRLFTPSGRRVVADSR